MSDMFPISPADVPIRDQIESVEREIKMREHVYPRRVADGKMKQTTADAEIARMRAVLATLESIGISATVTIEHIAKALAELSPDQRQELFGAYCRSCGSRDPNCQCWNDE